MIPVFEIKTIARNKGVPESTVERDYAQNWLLSGLSRTSLKMALKGRTGIRKVYIGNYRFSDDLDFTLLGEYDEKTLQEDLVKGIKIARETGIVFWRILCILKFMKYSIQRIQYESPNIKGKNIEGVSS
ncbi:nucleotidyl transferase AbiEii/AbiGii toxin family protein [Thermococcus sp.]